MKHILVIEDELPIIELLREVLADEGYQVTTAGNGQIALSVLASQRPDLIISDVMMPFLDGRQLCRMLKQDPYYADIPIILLTAIAQRVSQDDCPHDALLSKPFELDHLLETVETVFQSRL